jgi:hypothetical protein
MKIPRMFRQNHPDSIAQTSVAVEPRIVPSEKPDPPKPEPPAYVPEPSTTLPNVKATPSDIKAPSPMIVFKTSDGKIMQVEDFYLKANRLVSQESE